MMLLLLWMWLEMGLLQPVLKWMCITEMRKVLRVPITIETLSVHIESIERGIIVISGLRVKPPPVSIDDRWELDDIVFVNSIRVVVPLFSSLFLYVCSLGRLFLMDEVVVDGVHIFIEGFREHNDKISFNISVLGKKMEEPLPADVEFLVVKADMDVAIDDEYFSPSRFPVSSDFQSFSSNSSRLAKKSEKMKEHDDHRHAHGSPAVLSDSVKKCPTKVDKHEGIIHATKERLHSLYEHAKHSVQERIFEKLNQLHEYVQGPEPQPVTFGERFVCRRVAFDGIEINLIRALPYRLRHLERKPLCVDVLEFSFLGYERLDLKATHPHEDMLSFDSVVYPSKKIHKVTVCKAAPVQDLLDGHHVDDHKPSKTYSYLSPVEGEVHHMVDEVDTHGADTAEPVGELEQGGLEGLYIDPFSADPWETGLDVVVFKYWFERKLLFAVYKQNMKRLAADILSFNRHHHASDIAEELHGDQSFDDLDLECRESSAKTSKKRGSGADFSRSARGVVDSHPIFF